MITSSLTEEMEKEEPNVVPTIHVELKDSLV